MGTFAGCGVFALVTGLLAYAAVRLAFPEVDTSHFGNLIGMAALAGGALGAIGTRWWQRRRRGGPS